jgi:hypothetical protein
MRSLTIAAVLAVLFACATGAPAAVVGVAGATTAPEARPVTHFPKGAILRGDACFAKRSIRVMCPKVVGVCPAGNNLGQRSPNDCCKDACVNDCSRPFTIGRDGPGGWTR